MQKLLQAKPKKAGRQAQQALRSGTASITPAMRQHAQTRLLQALQKSNAQLGLETSQQQSGATTWEGSLFQASNSKSAYLSKLANAVAQIKRATSLAELDGAHVRWNDPAADHMDHSAATGEVHPVY